MTTEITTTLDDLAGRIRAEHEQVGLALADFLIHAMAAGDLLIEAKARVAHGAWLPWLAEQCPFLVRTAQAYMRLARNRATLEGHMRNGVAYLGVGEALALLTEPRPEPMTDATLSPAVRAAMEEAVEHVIQGHDAWWDLTRRTFEATCTAEHGEPVRMERWCADVSALASRPFLPDEGRRLVWIWQAYGWQEPDDRPWWDDAYLAARRAVG